MLTPMDIHNKEFKRSFRGYNEDEIDDFLDQVVNDYEKLYRDNERLKEELLRAQQDNAQYQKLEENLKNTLLVAQKTAEEVTSNARQAAEDMRSNVAKECQNLRREAELAANKRIDEATAQAAKARAEYNRILHEKNQFLQKMHLAMETELSALKDAMEAARRNGVTEDYTAVSDVKSDEPVDAKPADTAKDGQQ